MRRAAIVMPMRTPVGLPGGALAAVAPQRLISTVLSAVVGRAGIDPHRVEQLVAAVPEPDAVRGAVPLTGLSPSIGEFPLGGGPGAGLRALITAAMMVQTGSADVALALGAEYPTGTGTSESLIPKPATAPRAIFTAMIGAAPADPEPEPTTDEHLAVWAAAETARGPLESQYTELLAQHYGITRADADAFAATSHRRAARARRQGVFGAETAPVVVNAVPGDPNSGVVQLVDRDEGLRDDVSHRAFAMLSPFRPGGVTTVGNSSTRTLAASACLVVAEERLVDLGLEPMGYLVGWSAGSTGDTDAIAPAVAAAVGKALSRTGFGLLDLDLAEIDETSAVEVLALTRLWEREGWNFDPSERLNVHGAAIALGDPGGAAGLRMVTTLLHELARREGGYGLAATPTGPAHALAAIFESAHAIPLAPTPRGARFHGGGRRGRSGRHRA
ncbi:acetyl-CoA acetyltransferase [Nocardia sp. NPDC127526]|uniref:thiolase family protein n=1 Tax=Nocardia sp. NPDC127526 TaxID=3345393 RepID=UPI00362CD1EB